MAKRSSLKDQFKIEKEKITEAKSVKSASSLAVKSLSVEPSASAEASGPKKREFKLPANTIQTTIYMPIPVYKALQELALAQSTGRKKKLHDFYLEGLELVLRKYNIASSIAELVEQDK